MDRAYLDKKIIANAKGPAIIAANQTQESKTLFVYSGNRVFNTYPNPMDFTVYPPQGQIHSSDDETEVVYIRTNTVILPTNIINGTAQNPVGSVIPCAINSTDTSANVATTLSALAFTNATGSLPTNKVSFVNTTYGQIAGINGATFVSNATGNVYQVKYGVDLSPGKSSPQTGMSLITCPTGATFTAVGTGDYFILSTPTQGNFIVWFDVSNANTAPNVIGTKIEVDITAASTAAQVASAIITAFNSFTTIVASTTNIVDITNNAVGVVTAPIGATFADAPKRGLIVTRQGTAGVAQILSIIVADGTTFDPDGLGQYFIFSSTTAANIVWFNVDSSNTAINIITLASSSSAVNNYYNNNVIYLVSGTGSGQARTVVTYYGSIKTAIVDTPWITAPDNTSIYRIQTVLAMPYVQITLSFNNSSVKGIMSADINTNNRTSFIVPIYQTNDMSTNIPFIRVPIPTTWMKVEVNYNKSYAIQVRDPNGTIIVVDDNINMPYSKQSSFVFEIVPVRFLDGRGFAEGYGPLAQFKGGRVHM